MRSRHRGLPRARRDQRPRHRPSCRRSTSLNAGDDRGDQRALLPHAIMKESAETRGRASGTSAEAGWHNPQGFQQPKRDGRCSEPQSGSACYVVPMKVRGVVYAISACGRLSSRVWRRCRSSRSLSMIFPGGGTRRPGAAIPTLRSSSRRTTRELEAGDPKACARVTADELRSFSVARMPTQWDDVHVVCAPSTRREFSAAEILGLRGQHDF